MGSPLRQSSFVGGEVSPSIQARVDLASYVSWLKTCRNFIVRPQGGARNRPGTRLVSSTKIDQPVSLLPFVFNQDQSYVLEFGTNYIRFYRDGAQVLTTTGTPTIAEYGALSNPVVQVLDETTGTNPSEWRAQSFKSSLLTDIAVSSISAIIFRSPASIASVNAAIYSDLGGLPDVPLAGLGFGDFTTLTTSGITTAATYRSFVLIDPDAPTDLLSPATTYHVVLKATTDPGTGLIYVSSSSGNGYSLGTMSSFYGGTWHQVSGLDIQFLLVGSVDAGIPVEVETSYTYDESAQIKGRTAQSADVMFIAHQNHNPAQLKRYSDTTWTLTDITNDPGIAAPASPLVTGDTLGSAYNPVKSWWWVITSIDGITGSESFGSVPVNEILNVSTINPATVTVSSAVNGASGYNVYRGRNYGVYGYVGTMTALEFFDDGQAPDYTQTPIADPSLPPPLNPATPAPSVASVVHSVSSPVGGNYYFGVTAIAADESLANTIGPNGSVMVFSQPRFPVTFTLVSVPGATEYRLYRGFSVSTLKFVSSSATVVVVDTGADTTSASPPKFIPYQSPGVPPITFTGEGDRPSVACFMDQRLILAGSDNAPDSVFGSRIGNYVNFNASSPAGDDDAFQFALASLTVDRIRGLVHSRVLMGFTGSSEYAIQGSKNGVLGPSSIDAKAHGHFGSAGLPPLPSGGRVLFSQREGKSIREFRYDFQQDGYTAEDDRSVLSKHLLDGKRLIDWSYQKGPDPVVWMVRDDGVLLAMTYLPQHDVVAWHTHDTDGLVEAVCCIPEGEETGVYIVVARTVEGATRRFIERFASRTVESVEESVFLDCSLTYTSPDFSDRTLTFTAPYGWLVGSQATADITGQSYFLASHVGSQLVLYDSSGNEYRCLITAVASGLSATVTFQRDIPTELQSPTSSFTHALATFAFDHLIGRTVSALADGNVVKDLVVAPDGTVTLPFAASVVTVGLPYVSEMETLDINVDGKGQTVKKVVGRVWFDVVASRGLFVGEDAARMTEWKQRQVVDGSVESGRRTPLFTGRDYVTISGGWNYNGRVIVQQRDPLPCEITSITPDVTLGG